MNGEKSIDAAGCHESSKIARLCAKPPATNRIPPSPASLLLCPALHDDTRVPDNHRIALHITPSPLLTSPTIQSPPALVRVQRRRRASRPNWTRSSRW